MSYLEKFDDTEASTVDERQQAPAARSAWGNVLAWAVVGLGALYLLNPLAGIDLIPDMIPVAGNLDEAAVVLVVLGALRYLNIRLPEFIEEWIAPTRRLPSRTEQDPE